MSPSVFWTMLCIGLVAFAAAIFLARQLGTQGERLDTSETPRRVVSLELAWNSDRAAAMIDSWRRRQLEEIAKHQIRLDFFFIAAYAAAFLCLALVAEQWARQHGLFSLAAVVHLAAWGGLIAGLLDCVENVGMLAMLRNGPEPWLAFLSSLCASAKFVLGAIATLLILSVPIAVWFRSAMPPG